MAEIDPDLPDVSCMPQIREALGFTQAQTARRLGMSLRAYSDIETGKAKLRKPHLMALHLMTLEEAVARQDRAVAAPAVRDLADAWTRMNG